ncbi:terminase small subunit [Weissella paramesenteroides]|uniref:terminase small subunit n=1 Tax=Weissella paramesenteroides TaxID=1249 RepID=UPI003F7464E2
MRLFNATQAYINVYDVDYATAMVNGSRMLRNAKVQSLIQELREARLHDLGANRQDILTDLMKQSFSDIGNYLEFGAYDVLAMDSEGNVKLDVDDDQSSEEVMLARIMDALEVGNLNDEEV